MFDLEYLSFFKREKSETTLVIGGCEPGETTAIRTHLCTFVERDTVSVKCLTKEHKVSAQFNSREEKFNHLHHFQPLSQYGPVSLCSI